jgi:hypothetical protein
LVPIRLGQLEKDAFPAHHDLIDLFGLNCVKEFGYFDDIFVVKVFVAEVAGSEEAGSR